MGESLIGYNGGVSKSSRYDRSRELFVVLRVDLYQIRDRDDLDEPWVWVSVKEVVETEELAIKEVERLQDLKEGSDVVYFWQQGRFFSET